MKSSCKERERWMMRSAHGILGITLALLFSGYSAAAQGTSNVAKPAAESVQTFYLTTVNRTEDATETTTALRNLLDPSDKVFLVPSQNAVIVRATPQELLLAQKLIADLDHLKKTYRLTYTITESDGGKRIGTQHFSMIVVAGDRTTLKQGSKVPVATGTYNAGSSGTQTQMTYLDIGMNFDVSLDEFVDGVRLRSKIEQSSLAAEKSDFGAQDPIVRQTVLQGTSILVQGKPLVLGSLDIPGSTRHFDIDVVMEAAR